MRERYTHNHTLWSGQTTTLTPDIVHTPTHFNFGTYLDSHGTLCIMWVVCTLEVTYNHLREGEYAIIIASKSIEMIYT